MNFVFLVHLLFVNQTHFRDRDDERCCKNDNCSCQLQRKNIFLEYDNIWQEAVEYHRVAKQAHEAGAIALIWYRDRVDSDNIDRSC